MSSKAKQMADTINDMNHCFYPNSMYTVFPGSVLVNYTIFEKPSEEKKQEIKKLWFKVQKKPHKYYKTPEEYYDPNHTLKIFGLNRSKNWQVAVFIGKTNTLLAPYGVAENGDLYAFPIREDAVKGPTLAHPVSVHALSWENESNDNSCNSNL